ncbi:LysR family transcriptional regulator [Bacterioplanes sanyensis]|uniref:LysR family transcriptional regulator n=1 Tax=Bacterioplanes sanyensis TaxID=1249553 RepID=A0A222FDY9_9GAMM|nr:LysR substrate-binding domain-containing protein [Bacterioplanes sanyensis]ASP37307.1 LysR family transcriptional regulator [Bacterioplanes sanyensis]
MAQKVPPLQWLRAFEAAARYESFAAAAKEIHLTSAAVSHQVRSLEEYLGFKMFERLPRGLRLTDMGRAYLPSVRKAFDDLTVSTLGLFGADEQKVLTVRVSTSFASLCLAPVLGEFRRQYPHIDVRLYTAVWADRPEHDDADLEIRFGDGLWQGWNVQRLTHETSILVSAQPMQQPMTVQDYLRQQAQSGIIQIMGCEGLWMRLLRRYGIEQDNEVTGLITDNSLTALELARNGLGATLVSQRFALPYLESGQLCRPVEAYVPVEQGHYILLPEGQRVAKPEALLFKNWLCQRLAQPAPAV